MPLRGPSVRLATRREAGMPDQSGTNFSGSFICFEPDHRPLSNSSAMVSSGALLLKTGGENGTHTQTIAPEAVLLRLGQIMVTARGIFLTYTCEDCHDRKMAEFRPDVLTDPSYWTDEPIDED